MAKPTRGSAALLRLCPKSKDRARVALHCDVSTETVRLWSLGSTTPTYEHRIKLRDFGIGLDDWYQPEAA